jgi:FtsH-binding integral membrane protein
MIMNRIGCDDYILASIDLYLDIVNLFLYILQLMSDRRD